MKISVSILVFVLLLVNVPAVAQPVLADAEPAAIQEPVLVDYASFMADSPDSVRLEVYYKVFNSALTFELREGNYLADYELRIAVEDSDNRPPAVFTADKSIIVPSEEKTRSKIDFRTSQANFVLPPGDYKVRFALQDSFGSSVYRRDFDLELESLTGDRPTFSDVEFVRHVEDAGEEVSVFDKGNVVIVPSVSRQYEAEEDNRLLYYLELYQGRDSVDKVIVETIVRTIRNKMVYRDTLTTIFAGPVERQLREISTSGFAPGDYELELFLRGRRNKKLDHQKQRFSILWSYRALLQHDFKTALDQLALISNSSDEIKQMKNLETIEERVRAFKEFWLARDPTVGTAENEVQQEFYRRINYANARFRDLQRDGWRTDRGRIYVMHGEPDQIDDYPMSLSYLPYQIWHYYRSGRYKRFLFVDEDLDGDYRLQYPYDGLHQTPDF
jgi:GWxTD domain-containing protein